MLEDALKYPFRGEQATERLVIGGALPFLAAAIYMVGILLTFVFIGIFILPFSVVPQVFLGGYVVAVVGAVLAGREEPPEFENWKQLGIDGLKAVLVSIAYSIPLIVALFVFIVIGALTGAFAEQSSTAGPQAVSGILTLLFGLVTMIYSLVMYYVLPAAIINYVREGELAAAFQFGTIREMTVNGDYLVAWLLAAVVSFVGGMIAVPLYFVLVGFVLQFYTLVVSAYLVTNGAMDALDWTPQSSDESGPAVAPQPPAESESGSTQSEFEAGSTEPDAAEPDTESSLSDESGTNTE